MYVSVSAQATCDSATMDDEYHSDEEYNSDYSDDEYDESNTDLSGSLNLMAWSFTVIVILVLMALLLYRDCRPDELKGVFEPFDEYLIGPQEQLNNFIKKLKGSTEILTEKKKIKKRIDQQIEIELIKIRLESEKQHNKAVLVNDVAFWSSKTDEIKREIKELRNALFLLENEMKNSKSERENLLKSISNLDKEITKELELIKTTKFLDKITNVDKIFKEIYKLFFDTTVIKGFVDDLEERKWKIIQVIEFAKRKETKLTKNYNDKSIYKWLWRHRNDGNLMGKMKISSSQVLHQLKTESEEKDMNEIFKDLKLTSWNRVRVNEAAESQEAQEAVDSKKNTIEPIVKESQELERQLFILLSKDLNYFRKLEELIKILEDGDGFVKEFQVLKLKGGQFDHFEILMKRLVNKTNEQLLRLLQRKRLLQQNKRTQSTSEVVLIESWHRRNLFELFTYRKLTVFNEFKYYESKIVFDFSEKFNSWLKEKLLLLPTEKKTCNNIEKRVRMADLSGKVKVHTENLKWNIENDTKGELEKALTKKLSTSDSDSYEFVLDRVIRDYIKFDQQKNNKLKWLNKEYLLYDEGVLFTVAAHYGRIMRLKETELKKVREMWPKVSKNDETLLKDEEEFKKDLIKSLEYSFVEKQEQIAPDSLLRHISTDTAADIDLETRNYW